MLKDKEEVRFDQGGEMGLSLRVSNSPVTFTPICIMKLK